MSKEKIDIQLIKETPPHNLEAERTILGSILNDSKNLDKVLPIILPEDFYSDANRTIFSATIALRSKDRPIDTLTLNDVLERAKLLKEVGGATYISSLMDGIPRSLNVKHYARMVKEGSISRELIGAIAKAMASTYGQDGDPTKVMGKLRAVIDELDSKARRIKAPTQSLGEYLEEKYKAEKERKIDHLLGYRLDRFSEIARHIDGLQYPGLYLIGAYTNRGKTALLTSLALDALFSNPGITVMYFSLDDNVDTIVNRFLSIMTGIDINKVQKEQANPGDQDRLRKKYDELKVLADGGRLIIKDREEVSCINDLAAEIRERAGGKLVVFIDDVHNLLIGSGYDGLREENIDRANKIKDLAMLYKLPIICTAELRKKGTGEAVDRRPNINDFMETGKFAYNANVVWLLYSQTKNSEAFDEEKEPTLILDYVKNKFSDFTKTRNLVFTKAQGKIKEPGESEFD